MKMKEKQQLNVKKYANRKLYVVEKTSYVSMLELSDLVAAGHAVVVTDDGSGKDLTFETMARALYERAKVRDQGATSAKSLDVAKLIAKIARSSDYGRGE
jgi:polyhydroxyalkanoate synthesis regulator protein